MCAAAAHAGLARETLPGATCLSNAEWAVAQGNRVNAGGDKGQKL